MTQLTIFDSVQEQFEIGEAVEVINNADKQNVEDFYYLQEFEGSRGHISNVINHNQCEVAFKNRSCIFFNDELKEANKV